MPTDPYAVLGEFLFRSGTYLLVMAYLLVTARLTFRYAVDVHARWGRWETYPIPDWPAVKSVAGLLAIVGGNLLVLWFTLWWFA